MASFIGSNTISFCVRFQNPRALLISQRTTMRISVQKPVKCTASSQLSDSTNVRRSGNYQPSIWNDDYLQSVLTSEYAGDKYIKQVEELKEKVRTMINNESKPLAQLELVDALQRLGLAYDFKREIKNILHNVYNNSDDKWKKGNLYAISLEFRLLRQHGYNISQDVFNDFKDKTGSFKSCLCDDIKAMLNFYEASFYRTEGEGIMDEALEFTTKHLKNLDNDVGNNLSLEVKYSLDLPIHWWHPRVATRLFIDIYERREDKNHLLLELAKLDFNVVQGIHQEDLKDMSRWWKKTGFGEKLKFARSRIVTSFLWAVGMAPEPQYSYCRKMLTKAFANITTIDDIYDVYGRLDELEIFTEAFDRWDIKMMEKLPHFMKIAFVSFFKDVNAMAYDILMEQNLDVLQPLTKTWASAYKAHLTEAKWFYNQYKPSFEEYLQIVYKSIAGPTMSIVAYLSATKSISEKELKYLESHPDILYWASIVIRLQDDLGTASDEIKREDVPKAIQCYMHDSGASEEAAYKHIKDFMRQIWKKMNAFKFSADNILSQSTYEMILNLVRTSHLVYLHRNGHGIEDKQIRDIMSSLFFIPIPL